MDAAGNCSKFNTELAAIHAKRSDLITRCLEYHKARLEGATEPHDRRSAQRMVRSLKTEQTVETVINDRSFTILNTKCAPFVDFKAGL